MIDKHLSFSQLSTLLGCPEQHRLRYLLKLPSSFGYQATVGQAVHAMAEHCLTARMNGDAVPALDDAVELACRAFHEMSEGDNIDWRDRRLGRDATASEAIVHVDAFSRAMYRDIICKMPANDVSTGVEFGFDVAIPGTEGWTFRGAIDHIRRRSDGSTWIDDWKTSSAAWTQRRADSSLQVTAYLWALRMIGEPASGMTFHVLSKDARGNVTYQAFVSRRSSGEIDAFGDRLRYAVRTIGLHRTDAPSDRRTEFEYHRFCSYRDRCTPWELLVDEAEGFGTA
jgi:hypothetical protein